MKNCVVAWKNRPPSFRCKVNAPGPKLIANIPKNLWIVIRSDSRQPS